MNRPTLILSILVVTLLIWTNLYEYTSTDKLIYRSNRITHLTEFTQGRHEWSPIEELPVKPAMPAKPTEDKISNSNESPFADIDAEFSANDESQNPSDDGGDRELQVNKFE